MKITEEQEKILNSFVCERLSADASNEILMFFSMKCGALFDPLLNEDDVEQDIQRLIIL